MAVSPEQQESEANEEQEQAAAARIERQPSGNTRHAHAAQASEASPPSASSLISRMFDANYFRTQLRLDTDALGGDPIVELSLLNGHTHRIRSVIEVRDGYVVLEAYHLKGDLAHQRPRFAEADAAASSPSDQSIFRVTAAYESISAVVIDPSQAQVRARPGFA